MMVYGNMIKW